MQIAKLFLRGSLCNVTMRGLSHSQKKHVNDVVDLVLHDPQLQRARQSFIRALSNTIGNEYKDPACADEEMTIAIWRAAVSALYHDPQPDVIVNDTQRKKFFQEWIFNSLRQILNENKIPQYKTDSVICGLNTKVGVQVLSGFLKDRKIPISNITTKSDKHVIMEAEVSRLSQNDLHGLWRVERTLRNGGVKVVHDDKKYNVVHLKTGKAEIVEVHIPVSSNIKLVSFESKTKQDDDELRCTLDYKIVANKQSSQSIIDFKEWLEFIKTRLPADAKKALDIMLNPPSCFGENVNQKTVGQFLKKSPKEMARIFNLIRLQLLIAKAEI